MGRLRRWFSGSPSEDFRSAASIGWELAGSEYHLRMELARKAELEDAKDRAVIEGLRVAQEHLDVRVRQYPSGRNPACDVSRETLEQFGSILEDVITRAEDEARQRAFRRTLDLTKDVQ